MKETMFILVCMIRHAAACAVGIIAMTFRIPGQILSDIGEWLSLLECLIQGEQKIERGGKFEKKPK